MGNARNLADLLGTSTKANQVISTSGAITTTGAFTSVGIDDNADATTMTIDTSENIGIGNTSPSSQYMTRLVVGDGSGTEGITIYSGNDATGRLEFSDATSGDGRYAGGIVYNHSTNKLRFNTNGGNERLSIDSGGDVQVYAGDLYFNTAGKGICLGATSVTAANTLHDYEEGSWTPSLDGGGSLGINNATYTKVGKMVYVGGYIHSIGNSTAVPNNSTVFGIGGLPFTVISGTSYHAAGAVSYVHSFDWDALGVDGITTTNAATSIYFNRIDGSNATVKNSDVQLLDQMIFGLVYLTSD